MRANVIEDDFGASATGAGVGFGTGNARGAVGDTVEDTFGAAVETDFGGAASTIEVVTEDATGGALCTRRCIAATRPAKVSGR